MPTRDASSRRDAAWKPTSPKSTTAAWRISSRLARPLAYPRAGSGAVARREPARSCPAPMAALVMALLRPSSDEGTPYRPRCGPRVPAPGRARFRTRGRASGRARRCSTTARARRPTAGRWRASARARSGRGAGLGRLLDLGRCGAQGLGGRRGDRTVRGEAVRLLERSQRGARRVVHRPRDGDVGTVHPQPLLDPGHGRRARVGRRGRRGVGAVGAGVGSDAVGPGAGSAEGEGALGAACSPVPLADGRGAGVEPVSSDVSSGASGGGMRVTSGRGVSGRGVTAGTVSSPFAPPSAETSPTTTASPPPVAAPTMPATATTSVTAPAPAATVTHGVAVRRAGRGRGRCGPARRVRTGRGVGARRLLPGLSRGGRRDTLPAGAVGWTSTLPHPGSCVTPDALTCGDTRRGSPVQRGGAAPPTEVATQVPPCAARPGGARATAWWGTAREARAARTREGPA